MIIKRIKQLIHEFRVRQVFIESQSREIEWAHIYHDTINGRKWLENLQLSPGRWASNYSLLYILSRILIDYKPKRILEIGLGESSKLISEFIKNELPDSSHVVIEHNDDWVKTFINRYSLSSKSIISLHKSTIKTVHEFETNSYENLDQFSNQLMDLYLVDGISSNRFSRNYILDLLKSISPTSEFIVIIDDYNRQGELDTARELIEFLEMKKVNIYKGEYSGNKSQILIATEKYRFTTSL